MNASSPPVVMRMFEVTVRDRGSEIITAASRSKAVYETFLNISDCWTITFRQFLGVVSVRAVQAPADNGYGYVRRAYGVDPQIGQRARLKNEGPAYNGREGTIVYPGRSTAYVRLILDGETRISNVHPFSVDLLPFDRPQAAPSEADAAAEIPF